MNNEQFRKLLIANASKEQNGAPSSSKSSGPSALGSKLKASIPMTPRSVAGGNKNSFAQQWAEREQAGKPQKRARTSAPKGSKLGEGYVDRAKARNDEADDDRAARLNALEELHKNEEIDQATYEKLRGEIAGGDLSSTHLVKGLDFRLLEKVRRGEDVFGDDKTTADDATPEAEPEAAGDEVDFDDALGQLEGAEVQAVAREKTQKKKGQLSTAPAAAGRKRNRDQILAEMKAAREAAKAAAAAQGALGSRFKKIGVQQKPGTTRLETDSKGREVMIIVDEDGHERRKVRKIAADADEDAQQKEAFIPDKNAEVLGMEVPEFYRKKQEELERQAKEAEEAEVDIFDDVEEYDPLAGLGSDSDEDSSSEGEVSDTEGREAKKRESQRQPSDEVDSSSENDGEKEDGSSKPRPPSKPDSSSASAPRNYFQGSKIGLISEESRRVSAADDPAVLAALRKAKTLNAEAKSEEEKRNAEREERLRKMMRDTNRDAEDMDMEFGTNRQADEEDMEERDVKLAAWGDEDNGGEGGGSGKAKRKRGAKKRKGDVNSAADVLKAMERRKAEKS